VASGPDQLNAETTAAFGILSTSGTGTLTSSLVCLCFVGQPEARQRHAGEADAESLQRRAPCDRLGQAFGEFIELVVHIFPFVCFVILLCRFTEEDLPGLRTRFEMQETR
jgi:hypothetical protein